MEIIKDFIKENSLIFFISFVGFFGYIGIVLYNLIVTMVELWKQ